MKFLSGKVAHQLDAKNRIRIPAKYKGAFPKGEQLYYVEYAPAMSGDLDIVNNGDGTYEFTFSFLDDKGHTWSGHWSGNVRTLDYTTSEASIVPLRAAEEQAVRLNINNLNNLN